MIRQAKAGDRQALCEIWHICFGDSYEYIDFYMSRMFETEGCLVWDDNGKTAAMLHLLNADFCEDGKKLPAKYIYAAATLPEYRGRGIMAALLKTVSSEFSGCSFTFLLPAGKSLYDYYGRLGYKTAFYIKKAILTRRQLCTVAKQGINSFSAKLDYTEMYGQRQNFFCRNGKTALLWQERELTYMFDEWQYGGGDIIRVNSGYLLSKFDNGMVLVRELCADIEEAAAALLNHYEKVESFTLMLSPLRSYPFDTVKEPYGMMKCAGMADINTCGDVNRGTYVNLMLD